MRQNGARLARLRDTMKNTAPPRALRGQGFYGGRAPDRVRRGGCGRHEPPPKGVHPSGGRDAHAMGKPCEAASKGKPSRGHPAILCASRQKSGRSPTPLSPRYEGANGAPGSTPGAGARQGQRAANAPRPLGGGAKSARKARCAL